MTNALYAVLFGIALVVIFILTYLGNKAVPVPEGCDLDVSACGSCSTLGVCASPTRKEGETK